MSDRPRYPRSTCCVLGCARWSTLFRSEWLCGRHWRSVDRRLRTAYRRQQRKLYAAWEKAQAEFDARNAQIVADADPRGIHEDDPVWGLMTQRERARRRYMAADHTWWERIKREATLKAAGL